VTVLLEAKASDLLALVLRQKSVVAEKELGVADLAGPSDPKVGFGLER
jgi:hypothetical protein